MMEDLGQPIGYGRTAEIFAWNEGQVLKLFYDWFALENIENEARISRAIHQLGLPSPAIREMVRIGERHGLVYERVNGESMFRLFQRKPWNLFRYARRWAQLHADIHSRTIGGQLPLQRQLIESRINQASALPVYLRQRALAALQAMPDGDRLCHGDFWPGNILVTDHGEIVIDWIHASRGNPLADLARTTNLVLGFTRTDQVKRPFLSIGPSKTSSLRNSLLQFFSRISYPLYLRYYFELRPSDVGEYRRWLPIVAAARLSDDIPELEELLVSQVRRFL